MGKIDLAWEIEKSIETEVFHVADIKNRIRVLIQPKFKSICSFQLGNLNFGAQIEVELEIWYNFLKLAAQKTLVSILSLTCSWQFNFVNFEFKIGIFEPISEPDQKSDEKFDIGD